MSIAWILFVTLGVLVGGLIVCAVWLWLARSWEVLDDDQLSAKLSDRRRALWLRMAGWFTGKQRRLFYRRDKRGRFRKIWRG